MNVQPSENRLEAATSKDRYVWLTTGVVDDPWLLECESGKLAGIVKIGDEHFRDRRLSRHCRLGQDPDS